MNTAERLNAAERLEVDLKILATRVDPWIPEAARDRPRIQQIHRALEIMDLRCHRCEYLEEERVKGHARQRRFFWLISIVVLIGLLLHAIAIWLQMTGTPQAG